MRQLANTLFILSQDVYVSLDGENVVLKREGGEYARRPLHNIESILCFGYFGVSPALMAKCAREGIAISFLSGSGRFLARVTGPQQGNVLLRRAQYRLADSEPESLHMARAFLAGKLYNARWVVERAIRDHGLRLDTAKLKGVALSLKEAAKTLMDCQNLEVLRGIEGNAATAYFSIWDDLILQQKEQFYFRGRNRRPPTDNVNALLSFGYTLLTHDIAAALETVGLDPYVGFLHRDRPGRVSLALDLLEELRAPFVDRFVLMLVNKKLVAPEGFEQLESGAVVMTEETRKTVLKQWQQRKQAEITHPFLKEKVQWGMVPYVQALLLARYLREDLDAYPPFFWK